ncbi:MAG: PAS domain S-box protein [Promethearchaeia archaeon]
MIEKNNILLISKSKDLASSITEKLKKYDFKIQLKFTENLITLKSVLSENVYEIVLSDKNIWDSFGKDILKIMKEKELLTPYIVIGHKIDEKEIFSMMDDGVSDYIKRENLERLILAIKRDVKNKILMNKLKNVQFSKCLHEEEFQTLLEISKLLIWKSDLNTKFLMINNSFSDVLGYNKQETCNSLSMYNLIHPNDKEILDKGLGKVFEDQSVKNIEYRLKKKDGNYIHLLTNQAPIYDEQGEISEIFYFAQDLTEYRTTQEFIKNRVHRQEIIAEFGLEAISEKNIDTLFKKATSLLAETLNVEYTKVLELSEDKKFLKLRAGVGWDKGLVGEITVENNKNSQAGYTMLKTTPVIVENLKTETRFYAPKLLKEHNVTSGMSVIIPGKDAPFGILGAHTEEHRIFSKDDINFLQSIANILADVIVRNSTEEKLRKSEEKYRMLIEQSLLGTLIISNEQIIFANKAISDILGFSIDHLLSWDLDVIREHIHPMDVNRVLKQYKKIMGKNIPSFEAELRLRMKKKNNDYVHTRQYIKSIRFQGTSALHINIIDITEQKKNESLLEESLKEKEILLKEIHHRVKNNLQIISSLIVLQEQYLKEKRIQRIFKDFQTRIKAMALIHQTLYNSENFSRINLSKYIKKITTNLLKIHSVESKKVNLQLNIENIDLDLDKAMACGLIINELVSNSLEHAFTDCEMGKIVVTLKKNNGKLLLEVYDNGKDFPKDIDIRTSDTLGLKLVSTITKQMSGELSIKKNKGTHVKITW